MSKPIDEKIVKMSVDNAGFLSKVKETLAAMTTLGKGTDKIKGIDVSKAEAGVKGLGTAVNSVKMNALSQGIEGVKNKFSALKEIGIGALRSIGSNLMSTAVNTIKSWSGVSQGFQEYGEKMKAVQVITANTQGKSSAQDISKALDNLNHYADKTVYSFTDMTTSIGTFTAAGVGLNDATDAIQGLSNWAAESGTNTADLSRAEQQLSQAIASGTVKLQDWASVQNAGGLGGKKFQKALEATAKSMGKGRDMTKSFRDSLSDGWLTSEVLLKTLRKFKNDKSMEHAATQAHTFGDAIDATKEAIGSGWGAIFTDLFGGLEESTKLWTSLQTALGDMVDNSFKGITKLIGGFKDLGGKNAVIYVIVNTFHMLQRTIGAVKEGFRDVFPAMTAKRLFDIVSGINVFVVKMMLTDKQLKKVRQAAAGFFSIFDIGIKVIKAIGAVFMSFIPSSLGGGLLDVAANVGQMVTNFDKGLKPGKEFASVLKSIHSAVNFLAKGIGAALGGLGKFGNWLISIGKIAAKALGPTFKSITKAVVNFIKSFTFGDLIGAGGVGALVILTKKVGKIKDSLTKFMDGILDALNTKGNATGILDNLKESLSALTGGVKAATLMEIAASVVTLAVALKIIAGIKGTDLAKSLEAVVVSLVAMTKTVDAISKMNFSGSAIKSAVIIQAVANAVFELSVSLKLLSTIDPKRMASSLTALAVTMGLLVGAMNLLSKAGGKIGSSSVQIVALGAAVLLLSTSLEKMSKIKATSLAKSLMGLGGVFLELAAFTKLVNGAKISPSTSLGVVAISTSMIIMAQAIKSLASIKVDNLIKGLTTIGVLLLQVAAFSKLVSGSGSALAAVEIVAVAAAINMLVGPVQTLGNMKWEPLLQGLGAMAVVLGEVVAAMALANGSAVGAASVTAMAVAINLLVPPLAALSLLNLSQVGTGLLALGGALGIMVIAAAAMTPGAIGMLAFAAAMGALGLAVAAIGVGLSAFTAALVTLASMTVTQVGSIVNNFNALITGLGNTIPAIVQLIVNAVVSIAAGIAQAAPSIAASGLQLIVGLMSAINANIYQLVSLGLSIVTNLINGIASGIQPLIQAGINLMVQFIDGMANGIRDNGPAIVAAVMNLLEAVLELVVEGLAAVANILVGWFPGAKGLISGFAKNAKGALRSAFHTKDVGAKGGQDFADGVNSKSGKANKAGKNLSSNAKNGSKTVLTGNGSHAGATFAGGLGGKAGSAHANAQRLGKSAKTGSVTSLLANGSKAGTSFGTGIGSKKGHASTIGKELAEAGKRGAGKTDWSKAGKNAGLGFGKGISHAKDAVVGFAQGLASSALGALKHWLKIKSPSRVTMVVGDFFGQGFGIGMTKQTKNVASRATQLAGAAVGALQSQAGAIKDAMNDTLNLEPTVTPVLDASNLTNTDLSSTIRTSNGINGAAAVVNNAQTYSFGDMNISIESKDAQTAEMTMDTFKSKFKIALTDELRGLRGV